MSKITKQRCDSSKLMMKFIETLCHGYRTHFHEKYLQYHGHKGTLE